MISRLIQLAALLAVLLPAGSLYAEDLGFAGEWRQIHSNAGQCPTCRISVQQAGSTLIIDANNGWMATAEAGDQGNPDLARGAGSWRSDTNKTYAGKSFELLLVRNDENLHMTMHVRPGTGAARTIRGIFQRIRQNGI
ncbi:hypothetical protein IB238_12515 [Rhizobium sp. ARZ01]|uniref:hypothetical protein n=1 Tax=Rhizobium sp. ARZ01 TaxID=2769313 RepID=UPI00177FBAD6|nr:hypothetical protein [Rhizobium sp. ARZ01]MBD9373443.1 hypothetical protein [Rhizobium sp. ARZ01]